MRCCQDEIKKEQGLRKSGEDFYIDIHFYIVYSSLFSLAISQSLSGQL